MTIEEHKEFPVDSASLKEIRTFAREVLAKDPTFKTTSDDVVLALAEAAQNIVKHAYSGQPTGDVMRVEISFKNNQLKIDLYDKGKPAIPQNIKPRQIDDVKPGGLGTFFIGQIMDEVEFKTSASDWVKRAAVALRLGLLASASSTSASSCGESKSASQAVGAVLELRLVQAVGRSIAGVTLRSGEVAQAFNSMVVAARLAHLKAVTPE